MKQNLLNFAENIRKRGAYYAPEDCANICDRAVQFICDLESDAAEVKARNSELASNNAHLQARIDAMVRGKSSDLLNSLQGMPTPAESLTRLCALAHSAVHLMTLPPFERDNHKLRADGTLEPVPATKKG
jgi:hypothetical protein